MKISEDKTSTNVIKLVMILLPLIKFNVIFYDSFYMNINYGHYMNISFNRLSEVFDQSHSKVYGLIYLNPYMPVKSH